MNKLKYQCPNIELVFVETENCVANGSNTYLEIGPNTNSIEVEDWIREEGFEVNDHFII